MLASAPAVSATGEPVWGGGRGGMGQGKEGANLQEGETQRWLLLPDPTP